jgi:predicted Zn-ribbon and HTH transcriptional regulator
MEMYKLKCEKCGYQWFPRVENPWKCPRCQHVPGTQIRAKKID